MTEKNTIEQIEDAALAHSRARDVLAERIKRIEDDQQDILRRRRTGIRSALATFDATRQELTDHLEENPHLFKKPKTKIMHGLRIGFMKKKGKLIVSNNDKTIAAIKKLFPESVKTLINATSKPVSKSLNQLTAAQLKRLGVEITADTDAPVIKSTDSAIDKLIKAMSDEWIQDELAAE